MPRSIPPPPTLSSPPPHRAGGTLPNLHARRSNNADENKIQRETGAQGLRLGSAKSRGGAIATPSIPDRARGDARGDASNFGDCRTNRATPTTICMLTRCSHGELVSLWQLAISMPIVCTPHRSQERPGPVVRATSGDSVGRGPRAAISLRRVTSRDSRLRLKHRLREIRLRWRARLLDPLAFPPPPPPPSGPPEVIFRFSGDMIALLSSSAFMKSVSRVSAHPVPAACRPNADSWFLSTCHPAVTVRVDRGTTARVGVPSHRIQESRHATETIEPARNKRATGSVA